MRSNPVAEFGEIVLLLTLVVSTFAAAAAAAGARKRSRRLVDASVWATYSAAALMSLASAVIFFLILSNDYSVKYVHHYSDATMPWYYKLTSYWGGLDGSMMFWGWLLAIFAAIALWANRERHRELIPWVACILGLTLDFFLILLIFEKRPFDTFLMEAPAAGKGLNPLLQNPYMATHPPSLYIGLVSAAVPFAFGMAALVTGNLDDSWLRSVRRWVLISWFFLSLGLTLGMLWAYEVLGWGGFWGWDPVENAGALAWFTSTAWLHSIIVQERRGMLKVWNLFLVITSFLLTLIATFLTRSGFVQSVHAFGSDPVLKWSFLGVILAFSVVCYGYLVVRLPLLRSRGELDSWVSREFAFLVNNWILLSIALFILIATIFPSLSEGITGQRITLATPFYTQWLAAPGLILLFLTGVGPLIPWRHATPENLVHQFRAPGAATLVTLVGLGAFKPMRATTALFRDHWQFPVSLVCFGLAAFVMATIIQEFYRGARVRQQHTKLDFMTSMIGLVSRNKRRYGGYLVHVGIVFMFIGFAGGSYKKESEVTLEKGQQAQIGRYQVRFNEFRPADTVEKKIVAAELSVFEGGKEIAKAEPAKWYFPHHEEEPVTHVEIERGVIEDLYIVLNGYDAENSVVSLKLVINPLVNWIWVGFLLLALGTGVALSPERAYQLAEAAARDADGKAKAGVASLLVFLMLGLAGSARADEPLPVAPPAAGKPAPAPSSNHQQVVTVVPKARTPVESDLFHKIVCTCGTCGRELLADCTCGFAAKQRDKISTMLKEGASYEDVIKWAGDEALAVHPKSWMMVMAVYALILAGVGVLVVAARRMVARPAAAPVGSNTPARPAGDEQGAFRSKELTEAEKKDLAYHERLDDELDDLD